VDPAVRVDERVDVVTVFRASGAERLQAVPCRLRWRGRDIDLTTFGMRHPTAKGQRMIHVFEMGDGKTDYRLEFDAERLTWTLVSVLGAV
jgi:hypothetical protein